MRAKKFFVELIESPFPKYGFPRMGPIGGSLDIRRPALEGPSVQRRMKQKRGSISVSVRGSDYASIRLEIYSSN